jgi:class 3 adenylate cyclase
LNAPFQEDQVASIVVAETPNLAARLHAVAAPGTLVISKHATQLGAFFEIEDLGAQPLAGFPGRSMPGVRSAKAAS